MKNIHILSTPNPSRLAKLGMSDNLQLFDNLISFKIFEKSPQNIYITSDEEIKEGDWFIANNGVHKCIRVDENTSCPFITLNLKGEEIGHFKTWRTKIILTTDQDLIKDGIQAIDDLFLEWFVKNPSCEEVEVETFEVEDYVGFAGHTSYPTFHKEYKIIIPKEEPIRLGKIVPKERVIGLEEPKQGTLEEAAITYAHKSFIWPLNKQGEKQSIPAGQLVPTGYAKHQKIATKHFSNGAKWQQEQDKNKYSEEEVDKLISLLKQTTEYEVLQSFRDKVEQFKKK